MTHILIFLFFLTSCDHPTATTYYLVRHAEKACEDCNACGLSPRGISRAGELANYLSTKGIDAIFASQCLRTQNTAEPLASKVGKKVSIYNTEELNTFISSLKTQTNKDILIVGHSNQIPLIVQALSNKRVSMSDSDFDNLYVIRKSTSSSAGSLKKMTYGARTK